MILLSPLGRRLGPVGAFAAAASPEWVNVFDPSKIVYSEKANGATPDWRNFPVSGRLRYVDADVWSIKHIRRMAMGRYAVRPRVILHRKG